MFEKLCTHFVSLNLTNILLHFIHTFKQTKERLMAAEFFQAKLIYQSMHKIKMWDA